MKDKRDICKDAENPNTHSVVLFLPDITQTAHTSKYAPYLLQTQDIADAKYMGWYSSFVAKIYQAYPDSHQFQNPNPQLQVSKK